MVGFRFHWAGHLNTWGWRSVHFCLSCCFTVSGAKIQSMASRESFHTASRSRPNVEAASWYSWDKSVEKTPLSSVCKDRKTIKVIHGTWNFDFATIKCHLRFYDIVVVFYKGTSNLHISLLIMKSTTQSCGTGYVTT